MTRFEDTGEGLTILLPDGGEITDESPIENTEVKSDDSLWMFHLAGKHDQRKHGRGEPIGSSMEQYTDADGNWTPQRQKLHDEIVASTLSGAHPVDHPTVTFFGGGPASGKSTVMSVEENNVVVDADAMKAKLPEYNDMIKRGDSRAAAFSHEESSYLSSRVMNEGVAGGYNVTLDGTGDSSIGKLEKKVAVARAAGATVNAKYVTVDTDEAVRRATLRGQRTGRVVPESVIRETHANVSRTFNDAIKEDLFDSVQLWDNNGSKPLLIGEKPTGGKWHVNDETAWRSFLGKGGL